MTAATFSSALTKPASQVSRSAAVLAVAGATLSLLLLALLHVIRRDLNPEWHVLSEYAVGHYGWVMALYFFSVAGSCAALLVALVGYRINSAGARIGLVFLSGAAVGLTMAGLFPMDPITVSPDKATFSGTMHEVAGAIGVPCEVAAALVLSFVLRRSTLWTRVRVPMFTAAHLTWIFTVLLFVSLAFLMQRHAFEGPWMIGLANRLFMVAFACWIAIAAWPMLRAKGALNV